MAAESVLSMSLDGPVTIAELRKFIVEATRLGVPDDRLLVLSSMYGLLITAHDPRLSVRLDAARLAVTK